MQLLSGLVGNYVHIKCNQCNGIYYASDNAICPECSNPNQAQRGSDKDYSAWIGYPVLIICIVFLSQFGFGMLGEQVFGSIVEELIRTKGGLYTVFSVGLFGFFVIILFMPLRLLWILASHFTGKKRAVINEGQYLVSNLFLLLFIYSVIESFVEFEMDKVGPLLIPILSFIPFLFYLLFEWTRARAFYKK